MDEPLTDAATVDRLARIEVKLDMMRDERGELRGELHGRIDKQAGRLDRLERFMWLAVGLASAAAIPNVADVLAQMQ